MGTLAAIVFMFPSLSDALRLAHPQKESADSRKCYGGIVGKGRRLTLTRPLC